MFGALTGTVRSAALRGGLTFCSSRGSTTDPQQKGLGPEKERHRGPQGGAATTDEAVSPGDVYVLIVSY